MLNYEQRKQTIIERVTRSFRSFGGGKTSDWGNPISRALKDQPPQFAAGVDIGQVVDFIMRMDAVARGLPDPGNPEDEGVPMVPIYQSSYISKDVYGTGRYFTTYDLAMKDAQRSHGENATTPYAHWGYMVGDGKYILSTKDHPISVYDEAGYRSVQRIELMGKLSDEDKALLGIKPEPAKA